MKKLTLIFSLAIIIFGMSACQKSVAPVINNTTEKVTSMDNLKVPADFNWKTTHKINITLTAPVTGLVQILNGEGDIYTEVFLQENQAYTAKLNLPTDVKSVNLLYLGKTSILNINSDYVNFKF